MFSAMVSENVSFVKFVSKEKVHNKAQCSLSCLCFMAHGVCLLKAHNCEFAQLFHCWKTGNKMTFSVDLLKLMFLM